MMTALGCIGQACGQDAAAASNQSLAVEPRSSAAEQPAAATDAPDSASGRVLRKKPNPSVSVSAMEPSTAWYRTGLGALGIVLGCIGLLFLGLRRWTPAARSPDSTALRVLGRAVLSPKHSLAMVQFGRRVVLVGVSPDRVEAVSEISDPQEAAEFSGRVGSAFAGSENVFDEALDREVMEYEPQTPEPFVKTKPAAASPAALRNLLGRLKSLQS
jgi:flagellar biogenesis protein FliO